MTDDLLGFRRLLEYDGWANAATLASLRQGDAPAQPRAWIAHIIGSEWLWLARIRQEPTAAAVWPELDLDTCAAQLLELEGEWTRCLDALDAEAMQDGVGYRNSQGQFWTSTVSDIVTHVVLHSSYHRGQIAAAVREAGGTPADTDFVHAVRTGQIE